MKLKINYILSTIALAGPIMSIIPLSSCSCGNSIVSQKIDDSKTTKAVNVVSQQDTEAVFEFSTNDITISSNYLTAVAQIDNSDSTKFTISPKVSVAVENKKITATVSYDASAITNISDIAKFHITFTNSDPDNTWAQTIKDLTLTYSSPFFDNDFEYTGYLFAGQDAQKSNYRAWKITLDESINLDDVQIKEFKTTTGNITFDQPEIHKNTTHSIYVYAPYSTFDAEPGDTIGISLTLTCTTANGSYEQTYLIGLLAVDQLYLMDSKTTINTGADYAWYYFYMGLPLGDQEDENDITVEITQTQTSSDPMYIDPDNITKQLDWENNYFSIILDVKDNFIDPVNKPTVKFDIKITKPDTRISKGAAHGSAAWNQEFKDVELTFDGDHLEIVDQTTTRGTVSKDANLYFNQTFKNVGEYMSIEKYGWNLDLILDESTLPEDFNPTEKSWSAFAGDFGFSKMSENVLSIFCKTKASWPSEWASYITSKGSITCSWTAKFTCQKEITSSEPIKKYQKQVFEVKDWFETTFN